MSLETNLSARYRRLVWVYPWAWALAGCNALLGNEPGYLLVDAEAALDAAVGEAGGALPSADESGRAGSTASGTDSTEPGTSRPVDGTTSEETGSMTSGSPGSEADAPCDGSGTTCTSDVTQDACPNADCTPGTAAKRSVACACGGQGEQVRTCNDTCAWETWRDTTACSIACCAEVVFCNTQENAAAAQQFPNRGTWCRRTNPDCSSSEVRADCEADIKRPDVCDGRIVEEFLIED